MPQARCLIPPSVSVCLAVLCLAMLWSPTSVLGAERVIGAASSMATIFPDSPPAASDLTKEITLFAARGESESAQVAIVAGDQPLSIDRVEVSDLRRGGARIGKGNTEVRLVGYAEIKEGQNSWRGIKRPGLWPDPLLRFRPFTCPAGETRSLWVTVKVPRAARPGRYEGSIKLYSAGSLEASLPIRLTVWHFTLPPMPSLATSYWSNTEACYDFSVEPETFIRNIKLFGEYRVSTDLWPNQKNMRDWEVLWYLEKDGRITCDISGLKRTIEAAIQGGGFGTFQIGNGCWMGGKFDGVPIIDRRTGLFADSAARQAALDRVAATLPTDQLDGFPGTYFARLFLKPMCDWLDSKGLLERSYMQLYDEEPNPTVWESTIAPMYRRYRKVEPRLKLLGLIGIHPSTQGLFDIWSPHLAFYDARAYGMVRNGASLYGHKNFKAQVTASSTGGWIHKYQPVDAYDGCDYTKWTPGKDPAVDNPEWLRFDFEQPTQIEGLRLVTYGGPRADIVWKIEGSIDGQSFEPLAFGRGPDTEGGYSFASGAYRSMRLVFSRSSKEFVPTDIQPLPPPEIGSAGIREVEFLRVGLPLDATFPRARARPSEMWEYNVNADYPSVCIDADASEIRATAWQCWARAVRGYLNYGGAQWQMTPLLRSKSEDPLIWTLGGGCPGEQFIIYPGQKEALPSVRLARFRDGVDDYDYLSMLAAKQPDHPMLKQLRGDSRWPYDNVDSMLTARQAVGEALDKLYTGPGGRWILGGGAPRKAH